MRDEDGHPVAGATIRLTERHHYEQGEFRYFSNFDSAWPGPVTSDATGQFRFTDLREGRVHDRGQGRAFNDGKVEAIPAGTENVTVKLKPSG